MPKHPLSTSDAARGKRKVSTNVVPFKKRGRGRPKGPVHPFVALYRRLANPDWATASLARFIEGYGRTPSEAVVEALILLTWPLHKWPDQVAWFHGWRLGIGGEMRYPPSREKVTRLLYQLHKECA